MPELECTQAKPSPLSSEENDILALQLASLSAEWTEPEVQLQDRDICTRA